MNTADQQWNRAVAKAATPGSSILTEWRAQRQADRTAQPAVSNVTYSADIMEAFGVNPAAAGVSVTPTSAMRNAAVAACVQRISGGIAAMPVNEYERTATVRKPIEDSPYWYLLNESPTPRFTSVSMWEHVIADMLLRESGFVFMGRSRSGAIQELIPLPWSAVEPKRTEDGERLHYFVSDVRRYGCDQDDMLHFPGFGFDGVRAMSVIKWAARNAAGNALAMDEYSGRFFAGGAHPSIVLETDKGMKDDAIASLQRQFAEKYSGAANAHKLPLVLIEGLKANPLSLNAEDSQLLDARKFQVVDIARAFGVPPHLIGETSASTSWGSGLEELGRAFVTFTLEQHLRRIQQELNRKFFPATSKRFFEFNRAALLEGNSKAQSEYFKAALGGPGSGPGWMSVDEVRHVKHMAPKGGKCAEIFYPDPKNTGTKKSTSGEPDEKTDAAAA